MPSIITDDLLQCQSQLRQAEEDKALLELQLSLINQLAQTATLILDERAIILGVPADFEQFSGYSRYELLGKPADILIWGNDRRQCNYLQLVQEGGKGEWRRRTKEGELRWTRVSVQRGADSRYFAAHIDIDGERQLDEQLQQSKEEATKAGDAEKQFLASMSHEIRTPLNAIIGMTHLLYGSQPTAEQLEYLELLKSSADILKGLISDILDISKIEAGRIEPQLHEFGLRKLVQSVVSTFRFKAAEKNVALSAELDPALQNLIISDSTFVNQIFYNLVGNAEKFTHSGHIHIKVDILARDEDRLLLECSVADSGIGIQPEALPNIFDKFKQADQDIKVKYGGTGLGLAITRQIVRLLGGDIWVQSTLGQGTKFSFTFKVRDSGKPEVVREDAKVMTDRQHFGYAKILIAEDNFMNRKYIGSLLGKWEAHFEFAHDGEEAWQMATNVAYDMMFMDIQMPRMDGYEAARRIRQLGAANRAMPIVALTASALPAERDKAMQAGMDDFLSKPYTPDQLLQQLSKFLPAPEDAVLARAGGNVPSQKPVADAPAPEKGEGPFRFNPLIDGEFLLDYYQGDLGHAAMMFDIFLEGIVPEMQQLPALLEAANWAEFRSVAHKIKPTFTMVGLPKLTDIAQEMEKIAGMPEASAALLRPLLDELLGVMSQATPALEEDLRRLQQLG